MRRYGEILRVPGVTPLLLATLVVRLPLAINGLAVLLFVRGATGSFAVAGAAAGAVSLGLGLGTPLQGRLIDRFGLRLLLPIAMAHAAAIALLVSLGELGASGGALVAGGLVVGLAFPPAAVVLRALWPTLLRDRPDLIAPAYVLDSVLVQAIFVTGPLVTAILTALLSPVAALAVSAVAMVAGTAAFLLVLPAELARAPAAPPEDWLGALRSPGIRTIVLATLPVGIALGAMQVGLPAFSDQEGRPELAGVLLAVWSATSVVGGLVYGTLVRRSPLVSVHLRITALLPITFLPPLAATSPALMALLVVPAGTLVAPFIATRNELAREVAPRGAETESLSWPITALTGGISLGAALAGVLADHRGWQAGLAVAALAAGGGAAVIALRRRTLVTAGVGG